MSRHSAVQQRKVTAMTEQPITRRWDVAIHISEVDGRTHARAVLRTREAAEIVGVGHARLNPVDTDVPEIGAELATSRALSSLAHELLELTIADIEGVTHAPVTALRD
jgi:hypothetical protein